MASRGRRTGQSHADMAEQIKAAARRQMAEQGTAGLSLRAVARALDITAPAIYNYFPRLDDLITALIVDAFTALADHMDAATASAAAAGPLEQIAAAARAYRAWAVAHPVDFQLIYGNPIPGYVAPFEVTAPLARRPFVGLFRSFLEAHATGQIAVGPAYTSPPEPVTAHVLGWQHASGLADLPPGLLCLAITGWTRIHGLVMLELTHHTQPVIGDPAGFYEYELAAYLSQIRAS
jgi:AcrR family transcriptional regulator